MAYAAKSSVKSPASTVPRNSSYRPNDSDGELSEIGDVGNEVGSMNGQDNGHIKAPTVNVVAKRGVGRPRSRGKSQKIGIFSRNGRLVVSLSPKKRGRPFSKNKANNTNNSAGEKETSGEKGSSKDDKDYKGIKDSSASNSRKRKSTRLLEKSEKQDHESDSETESASNTPKSVNLSSFPVPELSFPKKQRKVVPFVEPPLAEPSPAYTGLPLESFPTAKIKKESLWQKNKKRASSRESSSVPLDSIAQKPKLTTRIQAKSTPTSTPPSETEESQEDAIFAKEQQKCEKSLKTNEKASKYSDIRQLLKLRVATPPPVKRALPETKVLKKIKMAASPKKKSGSTNLSTMQSKPVVRQSSEDDPTRDNDEFCGSCGGMGILLCCENCPKSFHFTCCVPPLEEAPEDEWFCRECIALKSGSATTKWNQVGLFSKLLNLNESRNQKEFHLPKGLRESTFVGVQTGPQGEYEDDSLKAPVPYSKSNGAQIAGYNHNEDLEIESLYKDDKPYLCHKCGQSGLHHRTLTHCEYCPLVWHLDCIEEPMFTQKKLGSKWMCPIHIERMFPSDMKRRRLKDSVIVDPSLQHHFLRMAQMSDFVIGDPDTESTTLQEFLDDEQDSQNSLNTVSTSTGVASKTCKVVCMSNRDKNAFIYRIPEESILLDFTTKVESDKAKILENIRVYDRQSRLEENPTEMQFVEIIEELKSEPRTGLNFEELVGEAKRRTEEIKQEEHEPEEEEKIDDLEEFEKLSSEEMHALMNTKRLMEMKGQEAMMEFLRS